MTRFGLYIADEESQNNDDELEYSSDEGDIDEEVPPHPLGFSSCRFGLMDNDFYGDDFRIRRPRDSLEKFLYPYDGDSESIIREHIPKIQEWPPLTTYIDGNVIPPRDLIQYANATAKTEYRDEMETLTELLLTTSVSSKKAVEVLPSTVSIESIRQPYELMRAGDRRIEQEMEHERSKMARNYQATVQAFKELIRKEEEAADKVLAEQARIDAAAHEEKENEQRKLEDQRQKDEANRLKQQKDDTDKREQTRAQQEALAAQEQAEKAAAAKEMEYITRAEGLMSQLKQVRAEASTFEASTNPIVKSRRLQMKKLVGGRVNTLAENADKIRSVAADVSQAITTARSEDKAIKERLQAGDGSVTPEMGRGKRYLVDLLCSKVMVRVQSDGFNGPRGDGFPLANMISIVSVDHKDFALVLEAHIYTECPTAIPRLPVVDPAATEEELMTSLGMKQNPDGTSETFKQFLGRTESIISLVADIMSSRPDNHTLLGGHEAAVVWLKRFLFSLPDAPTAPLPLLTAPILDAFLTGAGHMLANRHESAFRPLLDSIMTDILHRLDEGSIGAPSATRLKKTVREGFDGFKRNLPSKALAELYMGGAGGSSGPGTSFGISQQQKNPFNSPANGPNLNLSLGGGRAIQTPSLGNPFGGPSVPSFGTQSSFAPASSPFNAAPAPSPFPQPQNQGTDSMNTDNLGTSVQQSATPVSFGGGALTSPSPFGAAPAPSGQTGTQTTATFASPFGTSVNQATTNATISTFSSPSANTSFGFGLSTPTNTQPAMSSPFGAQNVNQSQPPAAFGGGTSSTPFGGATAPAPTPFGGGVYSTTNGHNAPSSTSFGGAPVNAPTPFSGGASFNLFGTNAPTSTSFGGAAAPTPTGTPFSGGVSTTSFGLNAPAPTPFGGISSTPFSGPSTTPFGGGIPSTPFGGSGASSSTPFGQGPNVSAPFGGGASSSTPFGMSSNSSNSVFGGSGMSTGFGQQQKQSTIGSGFNASQAGGGFSGKSKTPCKFFAKGQCRFGDNCKFSHDISGGGSSFGGTQSTLGASNFGSTFQPQASPFGASPFGGPRR
ncbi:hypothetical protein MPSEU_000291900 [Mayamaea pseudoterrestris]|nr:hypothetical protein MPSEU_000291900 [Mayamaea pseudoterrestris]